uniref:Uncharacterized protein n=1 Tax=Alexandrium catenella TaxID=2925 RepID=A0A7S1LTP9_ALECA
MDTLGMSHAVLGAAATVPTTQILRELLSQEMAGSLLWLRAVGEAILKLFGLDDPNALMAASQEDVERIKEANPQLKDAAFLVPALGRPKAFVMSGALLAPTGYTATDRTVVSLQMSPDFSGSPFYPESSGVTYGPESGNPETLSLHGVTVGGGFVESFAFGGQAPLNGQSGGDAQEMASPIEPLSLAKAVGISSAGPASAFTQFAHLADVTFLDPISNYWAVTSEQQPGPQRAMTYQLGDGGNVDNSGLLAALQRGATRLVWLINTQTAISTEAGFCSMTTAEQMGEVSDQLEFQLQANFGFVTKNQVGQFLSRNQVFAREELAPLLCELQALLRAGRPTMVKRRMAVLANDWWGIKSYTAVVIFVYADRCSNFEDLLPQDTKDELGQGALGKFANYPHYDVVFQNVGETTALLPQQVNLLAAQSEYGVRQNQQLFQTLLFCQVDTGGTCHIFSCSSSRNAACVNGHCVCDTQADMCAVDGACVSSLGTSMAAETLSAQWTGSGEALVEGTSTTFLLAGCVALAAICASLLAASGRLWRRRRMHIPQEPLLG